MRILLLLLILLPIPALAECRQALVLALDVSGSVNDREYKQQLLGLASALDAPQIRDLLLRDPAHPVHIAVFEWSSQNHQGLIQDWTAITDSGALDRLITTLRAHRKQRQGLKTAIGRAMEFAAQLHSERRECLRQTVDISGDGENNIGPVPHAVYRNNAFQRITVNALVIGDPSPDSGVTLSSNRSKPHLRRYFETHVIHGPNAFSMIAEGYEDYARAMERKLKRELALPVYGALRAPKSPL